MKFLVIVNEMYFYCSVYYKFVFIVGRNNGQVRLVGGTKTGEGRVEIWYNSQWNTVCDDQWDINDANVVCQQLGYEGAVTAHQSAHFGEGSGQILLDDLRCTGREASLLECSHSGINNHNCWHDEDASVTCECMWSHLGSIDNWQYSLHIMRT